MEWRQYSCHATGGRNGLEADTSHYLVTEGKMLTLTFSALTIILIVNDLMYGNNHEIIIVITIIIIATCTLQLTTFN